MATWNFGTLDQRLQLDQWGPIYTSVVVLGGAIALPFLAYPAIRFAFERRQIRFWLWISATAVGPILILFNLYHVHDYYAMAVSGSIAALVGLGVAGLPLVRIWLRGLLLAGATIAWGATLILQQPYWSRTYEPAADPEGVLPLAAQIERETRPDQRVAIFDRDWTPELLYYAHRWGVMVNGHEPEPVDIAQLLRDGYAVYSCPWNAVACVRITESSLGVPIPEATIGAVTVRTGLLESRP